MSMFRESIPVKIYDRLFALKRALVSGPKRQNHLKRLLTTVPNWNELNFLQVGANDGRINDPIREFVVSTGWSGVFVEPHPLAFDLLRENYAYLERRGRSFEFLAAAVSFDGRSKQTLWTLAPEFLASLPHSQRLSALRLVSFDRSQIESHLALDSIPENALIELSVPAYSINELLGWKDTVFDLVVIDIEGLEPQIFAEWDFNRFKPKIIVYETLHLHEDAGIIADRLTSNGYQINSFACDSIAVRKD